MIGIQSPNPFNPSTNFNVQVNDNLNINISVYDKWQNRKYL